MVEYYDWNYARTQAWHRHIKRTRRHFLDSDHDWILQEDLRVIDKHEAQYKAQRKAMKTQKPLVINQPSKMDFANQFYKYVRQWSYEGDIEPSTGLIRE